MPALIAHRGFADESPENTLTAVREAAAAGADMIEVDVRRCGSGEVVVIHDATVDRVTDGSGPVADHTADELQDLDVLNSGDGVPTLEAVVAELPRDVGLNVELKEEGLAEDTHRHLEHVPGEVLLSSFSETALADSQRIDPGVSRALLVDRRPRRAIDRATALDCTAIHPRARLCLRSLLVRRAHAADLRVNPWTITTRRMGRWLTRLGVDGLIGDSPGVRP